MKKITHLISQIVKYLIYAFMIGVAVLLGCRANNWVGLISGIVLFDIVVVCYEQLISSNCELKNEE